MSTKDKEEVVAHKFRPITFESHCNTNYQKEAARYGTYTDAPLGFKELTFLNYELTRENLN